MAPASRMVLSASSSRSAVLTPGTAAARSASRVRPTTSPAARISATSASLLIWIIRSRFLNISVLRPRSVAVAAQRVDGPLGDVLDRAGRVDAAEQAPVAVVADQRRGLVGVDLEPVPDGVLAVVVALEELACAAVALPRRGGRVEVEGPHVAAAPARPPAGQPPHHLVVVD